MTVEERRKVIECTSCKSQNIVIEKLNTVDDLENHVTAVHLRWNPFHCCYCSQVSPQLKLIIRHAQNFHKQKNCKVLFTPETEKLEELERLKGLDTQPTESFFCEICREKGVETTFDSMYYVRSHVLDHLHMKPYQCFYCSEESSFWRSLIEHSKLKHPKGPVQIVITPDETSEQTVKKMIGKRGEGEAGAVEGGKGGGTEEAKRGCKKCGESVSFKGIKRHVYNSHLTQKNLIRCKLCPYSVSYDYYLMDMHMRCKHPDQKDLKAAISDRRAEFKEEAETLIGLCFYSEEDTTSVEATLPPPAPPKSQRENSILLPFPTQLPVKSSVSTETCQLCKEQVPLFYQRKHILIKHIAGSCEIFLISCPVDACPYASNSVPDVQSHLKETHREPQHRNAQPVDKSGIYNSTVKMLRKECFPDNFGSQNKGTSTSTATPLLQLD